MEFSFQPLCFSSCLCSKHLQPRIPVGSSLCSGTLGNEMFFPGDFFGCEEFQKPLDFLRDPLVQQVCPSSR